ncbi:MAG: DUF4760 domain-containing protein [Anaerolineales bacterium]|nr:MAG: DUF4760 domain-containing protein [Anaerolineales bacterium]
MNLSTKALMGVMLLLTGFSFMLCLGLTVVAWKISPVFISEAPDFWTMVEAFSTILGAATVVSAGLIAVWQLREASSSRHIAVVDRLFDEMNSKENVDARRWVYQELPDDPSQGIQGLTEEGRGKVKTVLNTLDRVAFLTQRGWIPDEMTMPWLNLMVLKVWQKLGPYVDYESERRGEKDYYDGVRDLAERCRRWRAKHFPGEEITWMKDAL